MQNVFAVLVLMCATLPAAADVYKWVDNEGKIHYSDTPPAKGAARPIDLPSIGTIGTGGKNADSPGAEKNNSSGPPAQAAPAPAPQEPAVAAPAAVRGMAFDVYIMLRNGMTEGDLLQRAGSPDYESSDGTVGSAVVSGRRRGRVETFSNLELRKFYYYPTSSDPFTTVVTLTGGLISDLQRSRKF